MSREFEVTERMILAGSYPVAQELPDESYRRIFIAMTTHPSFRAQLRAWAAEEMRGLVASAAAPEDYASDANKRCGHNACRAETLANIERWRNENGA